MESAPAQSAEISSPAIGRDDQESKPLVIEDPERYLTELSGLFIEEFWQRSHADSVGLKKDEMARLLVTLGNKYNYGLPPAVQATREQIGSFWRNLQLQDLALAHACALGRDAAWRQFVARFRNFLTQVAVGITGSATAGQELADSLYSEMYGLTERDGLRRSPLDSYSGRGSLMGFLRSSLAQRNVDNHRRTRRETSLPPVDPPATPLSPVPPAHLLSRLRDALTEILGLLDPEERFVLSAWFLDRRTLLEISRLIGVHEATVSRRIQRLTAKLHEDLLASLRASGMSRAAAEEALGIDPGDLDVNLRSLLQSSQPRAFPDKEAAASSDTI